MGTLDLYDEKAKRKGKTLLEKLRGLAGADRSRTLPADASLVIAAERLGVTDLATLDRTDFSIYRTRTGRAFVNHF